MFFNFTSVKLPGDLILKTNIIIPSFISKEEEKLYKKIESLEKNNKLNKK